MPINHREYQESITKELDVIKNRVRNLIGNAHWGEEGRYKEEILKKTLRKLLPNNISVGTGFITSYAGISTQLDIIIYDNQLPLLFSEGDFVITTPSNVLGIIEVKSNLDATKLRDTINSYDEGVRILTSNIQNNKKIFHGIFSYEFSGNIRTEAIDEALKKSRAIINHFSLGRNYFIRHWKKDEGREIEPQVISSCDFYNIYNIRDLSFSYFISNLIDFVCGGLDDRYWMSFPIEGTKEVHRVRTVYLNINQS